MFGEFFLLSVQCLIPALINDHFMIVIRRYYKVMTPDGQHEVGRISKQWTGLLKEAFTDMDNFGIT